MDADSRDSADPGCDLRGRSWDAACSVTDNFPKPLVPVGGKPSLDYVVERLRRQGFQRILLLLGYRAEAVIEHDGDGSRWGVHMHGVVTDPDVQTLTRMTTAHSLLDDVVMTAYCDNYVPLNFDDMWRYYVAGAPLHRSPLTPTTTASPAVTSRVDAVGRVLRLSATQGARDPTGSYIGFAIIDLARSGPSVDGDVPFEQARYPRLVADHSLNAYVMEHRYYGVGSMAHYRLPNAFSPSAAP